MQVQTLTAAQLRARLADNLGPLPVVIEDSDGDAPYPVLDVQLSAIADSTGSTPAVIIKIGALTEGEHETIEEPAEEGA